MEVLETREWLDSLDYVLEHGGPERAGRLLQQLALHAPAEAGVNLPFSATTPYQNTIPSGKQPPFPGSQEMERRIKSLVRWNALAMVMRANKMEEGIGGHISTYASAATLYEVGVQSFFRAQPRKRRPRSGLLPGPRRARHLRPRLSGRAAFPGELENFRREMKPGGGLSFVSASLADAGLLGVSHGLDGTGPDSGDLPGALHPLSGKSRVEEPTSGKVWAFLGDGETDEPESLGAITLASREKLDNLIFVINCNLQRLDGPVRGNGKIIQELEAISAAPAGTSSR